MINTTPSILIKADIKGRSFFVTNSYLFMLINPAECQNQICIFDDEITKQARKYADSLIPDIGHLDKDQKDFIDWHKTNYWSRLFHLFIWNLLAKNNTLTYMKSS